MQTIVITGSTRGIGFGLADAFLSRGGHVTISGRTQKAVDEAVAILGEKHPGGLIFGYPCDVSDAQQLQSLWDAVHSKFGEINIWINNAGISGNEQKIWEHAPDQAASVVDTNIAGTIYGSQVAVRGMLTQGLGAIYNMEGMGSDGRMRDGLSLYGTSKYAVKYLTDALAMETKDTSLIIGALRPGMVITDLITDQYKDRPEELAKVKHIFNIIADTVDNVAPWLVDKILENEKTGVRFNYTPTWKILWRFASAPFRKRDLFADLDLS